MKKYAPWIKCIVIIAIILIVLVKIDPFSKIKNDPVEIVSQENLTADTIINKLSPDSSSYSDYVMKKHASIEDMHFDKKRAILKIRYNPTSHLEGQIEVRDFAYQTANLLNDLKGNEKIKGMEFFQKIMMEDNKNVKDAIYSYFDRENFTSIDYKQWQDDLRKKNKYPLFYNRANKYKIYRELLEDMEKEARDILKNN